MGDSAAILVSIKHRVYYVIVYFTGIFPFKIILALLNDVTLVLLYLVPFVVFSSKK